MGIKHIFATSAMRLTLRRMWAGGRLQPANSDSYYSVHGYDTALAVKVRAHAPGLPPMGGGERIEFVRDLLGFPTPQVNK